MDLGQAKLRAAFGLSPLILCVTGLADGRLRDVNDAFLRTTGYTREEVIGQRIADLGLWVDPDAHRRGLEALKSGAMVRETEARFRTKDGGELVAILTADRVTLDGEACVLTAVMDITDRVRAEEALRESDRRFLVAFHANPLPMSITDLPDGRHLEVNEAAVRHSGYARDEMLGRTKPELGFWVAPEQRDRLIDLLREHGRVRDLEVTFRTKGGEERDLLVNSETITFGGRPAVLSVSIDITDRKLMEAQSRARRDEAERLAQALGAANRAKDEFLAMLGHELRNPLGAITNATAVLEQVTADATVLQLNAVIKRQTGQLTRLVEDLLDVARVTSGKIALRSTRVDLHALVGDCLEALQQAGRARHVHVSLRGQSVWVEGDPARLEQIFNNLVDNALKYTPAGGRVTVTVEQVGAEAVLTVSDSGKGMPADLVPHVFDLFVQESQALDRGHGGLGLGLTLVRRLVDLHGGSASATSAGPGRGSDFTVRLPARTSPATSIASAPLDGEAAGRRARRVLVVEDGPDAREGLRLLLELAGHQVEACADGASALLMFDSFRPDVALIDIGLPGMDGYTIARRVRDEARARGVRLVALTGYGQEEDRRKALDAGFDVHATKPVSPALLRDLLR